MGYGKIRLRTGDGLADINFVPAQSPVPEVPAGPGGRTVRTFFGAGDVERAAELPSGILASSPVDSNGSPSGNEFRRRATTDQNGDDA